MSNQSATPDDLLALGIAAVRAGDRAHARACLLAAIQTGEHDVRAWYWLSRAVDSVDEREICLENVLALDPGHTAIQAELAALRRERAGAQQVTPAVSFIPATPEECLISDAATEPLPCPFCGAITGPLDRTCPACQRSLWIRERKTKDHSIYSLVLVLFWLMQANYAWLGLCFVYLGGSLLSAAEEMSGAMRAAEAVAAFLGVDPAALLGDNLPLLPVLAAAGGAFGLSLAIAVGLYLRSRFVYWLAVGLTLLGLLAVLYQAATAEHLPLLWLLGALLLSAVTMGLVFRASDEYEWRERRLAAVLDPDVNSDSALVARGRQHAAQGMWARAAVHWSRAVALNPSHPGHRLALATAYVNLGQPERAREHAEAAQRLDPADPEATALLRRIDAGLAATTQAKAGL